MPPHGDYAVVDLPEDRTLAGFSFDEARELLHAQVLVPPEADPDTCDYLVISPISSDAGQPYFRRFHTKVVVVRFDRTDMHLAAIQAQPEFLILTGGHQPSGYTVEAATVQGMPILLSSTDTENTVMALEAIYQRTRFRGQRKLERVARLLDSTPLYTILDV